MSLLANMGGGPSYASVPVADPSSSFAALSSGGGHVAAGAAGTGGGSLLSRSDHIASPHGHSRVTRTTRFATSLESLTTRNLPVRKDYVRQLRAGA